jgi:DNA-directed RNA polymerase specialized sigma24 family protein
MPVAGISPSNLESLHRTALRYAGTHDEADDLVQDLLLAALEQQRAWDGPRFLAWARGVLRRRALFIARTEGRRRRREAAYAAHPVPAQDTVQRLPQQFIETLAPSLRIVALLANVGLGRAEIESLLGISDTALRQRISSLRRAWRSVGVTQEMDELPRGYPRLDGPQRRSLKTSLTKLPGGRLAIADPDGLPIFFGVAHKSQARGNQ